ncbi:MAG: urate hydroxylase PuuD [Planctomycetota bacterium]|nr:urate hydroxylase PuuD [Planctomycetota bacterium]
MDDLIFAADHGQLTFRWAHVLAGGVWIGILYFFNWINGAFAATMDGETKRKVIPELMPRALYWFRWGAAWTWFTGVCLLFVLYYVKDTGFYLAEKPIEGLNKPTPAQWGIPFGCLLLGFLVYDVIFKFAGKPGSPAHAAGVIVWGGLAVGFCAWMQNGLGMSLRASFVHVGALFGTAMAANVWMRIWPAQKRIITAIKAGEAPNGDDAALAGSRSKHNTYMSVPLLFLMVSVDQGKFGDALALALILAASWVITFALYKKSAMVKGF